MFERNQEIEQCSTTNSPEGRVEDYRIRPVSDDRVHLLMRVGGPNAVFRFRVVIQYGDAVAYHVEIRGPNGELVDKFSTDFVFARYESKLERVQSIHETWISPGSEWYEYAKDAYFADPREAPTWREVVEMDSPEDVGDGR